MKDQEVLGQAQQSDTNGTVEDIDARGISAQDAVQALADQSDGLNVEPELVEMRQVDDRVVPGGPNFDREETENLFIEEVLGTGVPEDMYESAVGDVIQTCLIRSMFC